MSCRPSIALIASRSGSDTDALRLLLSALGLPQVGLFHHGDPLPKSVHTAVAFEDSTDGIRDGLKKWRVAKGDDIFFGSARIILPDRTSSHEIRFPSALQRDWAPAIDDSKSDLENAATLTGYYAVKRYRKRSGRLRSADTLDLLVGSWLLRQSGDARVRSLQTLFATLVPDSESVSEDQVAQAILRHGNLSESIRTAIQKGSPLKDRVFFTCPELAIFFTIRRSSADVVRRLLATANKTIQLAYFAAAAIVSHDRDLFDQAIARLLSKEFFDSQSKLIRIQSESESFAYSATLAAVLHLAALQKGMQPSPACLLPLAQQLKWECFPSRPGSWPIAQGSHISSWVDPSERIISRSLLDNWLLCLTVPEIRGMQFELTEASYEPVASYFEHVWACLFRRIQLDVGQPFLRIRPWPFGTRAALSLRFDIDREPTTEQVDHLLDLQIQTLSTRCGTWFSIPGTGYGEKVTSQVYQLQETGWHIQSPMAGYYGKGVTCHSGPHSRYWRGAETILDLEQGQAAYGEMLASQLVFPRRGWVHQVKRPTTIPLLPIHFPLEGSTHESDLSFFDRLLPSFDEVWNLGGHIILETHPDVNGNLLDQLLRREDLENTWFASLSEVVNRFSRVMDYGNIQAALDSDQKYIHVRSLYPLSKVHLEIEIPQAVPTRKCISLDLLPDQELLAPLDRNWTNPCGFYDAPSSIKSVEPQGALPASHYDRIFTTSNEYRKPPHEAVYSALWNTGLQWITTLGVQNIIELGCGPGHFAQVVSQAQLPPLKTYRGLDFSKMAIRHARRRLIGDSRFQFVLADLRNLSAHELPSDSALYIAFEVLEHLENDRDLVSTIPKRSTLLFSVPTYWAAGHVRVFRSRDEILGRYQDLLSMDRCDYFSIGEGIHLCLARRL